MPHTKLIATIVPTATPVNNPTALDAEGHLALHIDIMRRNARVSIGINGISVLSLMLVSMVRRSGAAHKIRPITKEGYQLFAPHALRIDGVTKILKNTRLGTANIAIESLLEFLARTTSAREKNSG